ncbi:15613_t:CDS:2, partial [Gigaspora margarita]
MSLQKESEYKKTSMNETLEPNIAKRQKKLKFKYPYNNNPLSWDEKVEFEL